MREKSTTTPIIHSVLLIMYGSSYMFRHYIAILKGVFLVPSERCSIEEQ
jgi:hypothetical protein